MVGPVSSSSTPPRYDASNVLLDKTGWNAKVSESFLAQLNEASETGDLDKIDTLGDIFQKAVDSAAPLLNAPQTGVTQANGPTSEGQGFRPSETAGRLDPVAIKKGNAPSPMDQVSAPLTEESTQEIIGKSAVLPNPGIKTTVDSPVRPGAGSAAVSEGAQAQKVSPLDGTVDDLGGFAEGDCVSLENSPFAIAKRQRQAAESQGQQMPGGWDQWEKNRGAEMNKSWVAAGGVQQLNPKKLVAEAAQKAEAAGMKLTPEFTNKLEIDLTNHAINVNGGLVVTGGQYQQLTQNQYGLGQNGLGQMAQRQIGSRLVGGLLGGGVGAALGTVLMPGVGTMIGGMLGSSLGSSLSSVMNGGAMVNPALMGMPGLSGNPVAMGMGAGLSTVGMMSSFMGGGNMMQQLERGMAGGAAMQYQMMNQETRLKRLMTKQALVAGDQDMVRMLTSSNMPIEKLVAMWSLKNCSRYDQELRDKMLAAEDARQREKIEANKQEAKAGVSSMVGTVAAVAGTAFFGPIGGMIGSAGGGLLASALTSSGGLTGGDGGQPPPSAAALQLEVQMALEEWKRSYELASNILKSLHDMSMTAINNSRG